MSEGKTPPDESNVGALRFFEKLPAPLLLVLGIVFFALPPFLNADPPQIWPAAAIVLFAIGLGAWAYHSDQRRKVEENLRREAEARSREAASARDNLRQLVETCLKIDKLPDGTWTRPMLRLPLPADIADPVCEVLRAATGVAGNALKKVITVHR